MDLTTLDDKQLVLNIQKKNDLADPSIEELTNRHTKLYHSLYQKFNGPLQASGVYPFDIFTDPKCIVYEAAESYDKTKDTKFSTWLYNYIRYECLNAISAGNKMGKYEEKLLDYLNIKENQPIDNFEKEDKYKEILELVENLEDRNTKNILKKRFLNPRHKHKKARKWKQIAKVNKMSVQDAIRLKESGLNELRGKLENKEKKNL